MIFYHHPKKIPSNIKFEINQIEIERVSDFVFLGLTINENLSWKPHVSKISNKISKYVGILNKLKKFLPPHILRILYCSMVQSHMTYAILTWGFDCGRLEKLQKKIIRIITCSKFNAHTEPLLKDLSLLKIKDMFTLSILKFYHKLKNNNLPKYFDSYKMKTQAEIHNYETRAKDQIANNITRTKFAQNCLRNKLPSILNHTSIEVLQKIETHSFKGFSNYVKNRIIKSYTYECTINNCYICNN